jgi:nitroreductase
MKHFKMMNKADVFNEIVEERRAIRRYDENIELPEGVVERSLYRATLSPSSSNMQLYEFYRINKKEDLKVLAKYCMGQGTATSAKEMIVVVVRLDKYRERAKHNHDNLAKLWKGVNEKRFRRVDNYYRKLMPAFYFTDPFGLVGWIKKLIVTLVGFKRPVVREVGKKDMHVTGHKSAALAAQTFMLSVTAEGFGTCPMEGMDSKRIKKWLKLPRRAEINMVISVGAPKYPEALYNERLRVPLSEVVFEKE